MSLIVHYHFPCGHTDSEEYESFEIFCNCDQEAHERAREQNVVMDETCVQCKITELELANDECCEMALEELERELEVVWDV